MLLVKDCSFSQLTFDQQPTSLEVEDNLEAKERNPVKTRLLSVGRKKLFLSEIFHSSGVFDMLDWLTFLEESELTAGCFEIPMFHGGKNIKTRGFLGGACVQCFFLVCQDWLARFECPIANGSI